MMARRGKRLFCVVAVLAMATMLALFTVISFSNDGAPVVIYGGKEPSGPDTRDENPGRTPAATRRPAHDGDDFARLDEFRTATSEARGGEGGGESTGGNGDDQTQRKQTTRGTGYQSTGPQDKTPLGEGGDTAGGDDTASDAVETTTDVATSGTAAAVPVRLWNDDDAGFRNEGEARRAQQAALARVTAARPRLAVHCFAFNRPENFQRLWEQLMRARPSELPTHFVIHVDYDREGSEAWREQVEFASALSGTTTQHGPVTAVFAASPKGLRATMLEAWAPVEGEYAMFLEDDIEVSEMLFVYAAHFVQRYGEREAERDPSVLGYKLYNQKWDEVNQRYERAVKNGHMPFKIQEPCSWGTVFVAEPYAKYLRWYVEHSGMDPFIPHAWSNTWDAERSAKKYLQRFMWEEAMFLISVNLPHHKSLTSPHVEAGTNIKQKWLPYLKERLEVPLLTAADEQQLNGLRTVDNGPRSQEMVMLNTSHDIVSSASRPGEPERRLLSMNQLPPNSILDPVHHRGARSRVVSKAKQRLHVELSQWPIRARRPGDISPADDAALRELLARPLKQASGLPLPPEFLDRVTNPYTLYAIGVMLLSPLGQRSLLVETEYGLTNRLRAYGSAKAIADASARQLVVLWVPDAHCYARMDQLFVLPKSVIVVEDELVREVVTLAKMDVYDLMQPENKLAEIDGSKDTHIYVRSAFRIHSRLAYGDTDALHIRSLVFQPSSGVRKVLNQYYDSLAKAGMDVPERAHRSFVGVHIRMLANMTADTPGLSEEEALRMQLAVAFRVSCHYRFFAKRMVSLPRAAQFFVSTDTPSAFEELAAMPELRGRVHRLDSNQCTARTADCILYAAADLYLLSATSRLYTSRWSAFSETAARVGGMPTGDGCDEPEGGWRLQDPKEVVTHRILGYLEQQQYPDVAHVRRALNRYR